MYSITITDATVGRYFDVCLGTRKHAQTGETHAWRLWANDDDPKLCPMRAIIMLAGMYGTTIRPSGPLFLKVSAIGAILPEPLVCYVYL